MKKIKVVRVIARLNIGGPAIHTILLTDGLNKDKFDSLLVCGTIAKDEGDMLYYARARNVVPYIIPELRRELNPLNDVIAFLKIYKLIRRENPDIIHTHTAKAGTLGRLAGIFYNLLAARRIKLIHTFHGHVFEGYFGRFKTRLFIFIERLLAYFNSKIITVSSAVKEELVSLRISSEAKIEVIPLGLELDRFLELPLSRLPIQGTRDPDSPDNAGILSSRESGKGTRRCLNIGIVGRLVPIKNHRLFLESAAKVIRDNPALDLKFKIIGDGELRAELKEFTQKLNLNSAVEFSGWQNDLSEVYSDLDIVCLTSINEGTPVSLIEAMASGKAVAATDAGGVKDLVGESLEGPEDERGFTPLEASCRRQPSDASGVLPLMGFTPLEAVEKSASNERPLTGFSARKRGIMVRSGDADSFAGALSFLLRNEVIRKKMAAAGREFVREKFAKKRLIKDIESLYEQVVTLP